jgi:manganese/iron transport system substrate-binding protein
VKHLAMAAVTALLVAACAGAAHSPAPTQPTGQPTDQPTQQPTLVPAFPTPTHSPAATPQPEPSISVVTTISTLADLIENVAGSRAEVRALVPRGTDVHTFDPSPSDAVFVSGADLLVMNGLGLDEWLTGFVANVGAEGVPLVELAEDLPGVEYLEGGNHHDDEGHEGEHDAGDDHAYNPHLWMNVAYAQAYVERIADELSAVDPAGEADYRANAAAYTTQLEDLDGWVRDQLAGLPAQNRRVVSFHDAFPYFAAAYDLEIVGVLVEVPGRDPSAGEVARVITAIRDSGVRLILAEAQFSDQLAQAVADETEAEVIRELYTDSLGDPPADTFVGAMRWNVEQIVQVIR